MSNYGAQHQPCHSATSNSATTKLEPRFRDLAESLPHMVWTCEAEGPCDYLSPQWVAYTGIPESEQLGYRWLERLHPEDVEVTKARWARAAASGQTFDTEFRVRRHDGVYRWFKTRAVASRDSSGRVVKWFGSNTDIQELRDAQDAAAKANAELERRVTLRTEELRAANQRLTTVAAQLQTAQRVANVGSWEMDAASGQVRWSDELYRIFGLDPAEAPPNLHMQAVLFEPESWERLRATIAHSVATGEGYKLTLAVRHRDGRLMTTVARAVALRGPAGGVERLVGTFQDISERARIARQLKHTRDRLKLATSAAKIGVWDWDLASNAVVWDETMRAFYEPCPDEPIVYDLWRSSVHPEDRPDVEAALQRAVGGDGIFNATFRIVCPSGKEKHMHASATLERDATGRGARMIGVNWDVTEQRVAELALRRTEALQRAILAYAGLAIIATGPDGTITLFNRAAERLLGYQQDEIVGKVTPVLFHRPAEIDAQREVLTREGWEPRSSFDVFVVRSRSIGTTANEWTYVRKDGGHTPVLLTVTTLRDEAGGVLGYLGVALDLAQQKQHERELLELNRLLADRSAQMEVLLQEVHHRVKNNLQVIASLMSMQGRMVREDSARLALSECRTRIQAIALIHEQLYQSGDYSRVPFSDYAQQLARSAFAASGTAPDRVRLVLDIEKVALPVEKAIPCGLMLNELISNALKHGFPGDRTGTVRVSLHRGSGDAFVLSVADDGIGLGQSFNMKRSGSLGMQLVSDLSAQIDAQIEIESKVGTEIRLVVPAQAEEVRT